MKTHRRLSRCNLASGVGAVCLSVSQRRWFETSITLFILTAFWCAGWTGTQAAIVRSTTYSLPGINPSRGKVVISNFIEVPAVSVKNPAVIFPPCDGCASALFGKPSDRQANRLVRFGLTGMRTVLNNRLSFDTFVFSAAPRLSPSGPFPFIPQESKRSQRFLCV